MEPYLPWLLAGCLLLLCGVLSYRLRARRAEPSRPTALPRDPYAALRHIQATMDGLFDELFVAQSGRERPLATSTGDGETIHYEVPLPPGVTAAQVKARVHGNVLRIEVPRPQQARPRDISIE